MSECTDCKHPEHGGHRCDYAITETYRDDVGIFAKPSGFVVTDIVDTCACESTDRPMEGHHAEKQDHDQNSESTPGGC